MKNHFGVKWFYIEPLKNSLMIPKWFFIEPFKEPLEGS